ncbi:MAG: GDSL-type esterase/lipase family protein [Ilumatobacteraceae bacterium]
MLGAAAVSAVTLSSAIALEVRRATRLPLPTLEGIDASGTVDGRTDGPPLRVVALGDSTLTGPGISDPSNIWLRKALGRLELEPAVEMISLAVGGSRVVDVLARVPEAIELEPEIVVVAVGSNDALHGTPARRFAGQFDELLDRLTAHVPVVAVANVGDLGNIARARAPLTTALRLRARTVCRTIERTVARHDGVVLLDVTPSNGPFRNPDVFAADLFHPSEVGHSIWAETVAADLRVAFDRLHAGRQHAGRQHA